MLNRTHHLFRTLAFVAVLSSTLLMLVQESKAGEESDEQDQQHFIADKSHKAKHATPNIEPVEASENKQNNVKKTLDRMQNQPGSSSDKPVRVVEADTEKERQIQQLMIRAVELRREQKYERALEQLRQAELLDRTNPTVQLLKQAVENLAIYEQIRTMRCPPRRSPFLIKKHKGAEVSDVEANRRVMLRLRESVPINFENHKLITVLRYLQETTGVVIVVNWEALKNVGAEKDLPITLRLSNVSAVQALDFVMSHVSAGNDVDLIGFGVFEGHVHVSTLCELECMAEMPLCDDKE